jgi:hypothetical protein
MKTLLLIALFPLLCSNALMGQTLNTRTRMNDFYKPLDFNNNHGISGKDGKYEMLHPNLPETTVGNQYKSALTVDQKPDSTINETWDSIAGQWVVSGKAVYTYDANGNNTLDIGYYWFEQPGKLFKYYKAEKTFDANGNETSYIGYFWAESSNDWIPSVKEDYIYDTNGKVTLINNYDWYETSNSQWIAYMKREYSYDINGDINSVIYFNRDTANTQWNAYMKEEYAYNTGDSKTLALVNYFNWDIANTQWLVYAKDEYTYDANGNITLIIEYEYDADLSQWFNISKFETTYDAYGDINTVNYSWNRTTNEWDAYYETTVYYPQHDITGVRVIPQSKISVYPNPASGYVIFDGINVSSSAKVEVFDMEGKKVLEQKIPENRQINVGSLHKGQYLYRLQDNGKINAGKIVVE